MFDAAGLRSLEFSGSRFYLRDGLLELWLAVIVDALSDDAPPARWKWRLEDDLRDQATIVFEGLVVANIDAHITSPERLQAFTALCSRVRAELASGHFAIGPFAQRVGAARWNDAMPERLLRITDAVLWMVTESQPAEAPTKASPMRS